MKTLLLITGLLAATISVAQTPQHCSAAFLGNRMVVNKYTPKGTCRLPSTATGNLSVQTVDLSDKGVRALAPIPFRLAIRDKESGTLLLFSEESFRQVNIRNVLTKCRKGDHIVLLTTNRKYALPHNEIVVE